MEEERHEASSSDLTEYLTLSVNKLPYSRSRKNFKGEPKMKLLLAFLLAFTATAFGAEIIARRPPLSTIILGPATTTGAGTAVLGQDPRKTYFECGTTSAGSGSSTTVIEVSDKQAPVAATNADWIPVATITLTLGTTQTCDGFTFEAPWKWARARVSAISGTTATVTVWQGQE